MRTGAKICVVVAGKTLALTIILFILFAAASTLIGPAGGSEESNPEQARAAAIALLAVCFLQTAVLSYLILRSRWSGWRLIMTVFLIFFGIATVMGQMESAVFLTRLSGETLLRLLLMGALIAAFFSPIAVLLLGRWRQSEALTEPNLRLVMPKTEWLWKLMAVIAIYLTLYFTFGYFIAWKNPAVREFYGGADPGSFPAHMSAVLGERPWLVPFQALRALMWVLLALPMIRMLRGRWWEVGLGVGAAFAVLMSAPLLLPNPYMPMSVRLAHLVEIVSSNFIFGWLTVWLLNRHHASLRELFGWSENIEIESAEEGGA